MLEEYVSVERARDVYGVAIENGAPNLAETERLRSELRSRRFQLTVTEAPTDEFDDRGCRVSAISREAAARLEVADGDMVEHVSTAPAPIRAWVRVVDAQARDELPLGPVGRRMLHVAPGDEVWVRKLHTRTAKGVR